MNYSKKIVIPGGSGFLGMSLARFFERQGYSVIVLSRKAKKSEGNVSFIQWDGKLLGPWADEFENASAIINMAGRTVDCRYTEANKAQILNSRLDSTKIIGEAIQKCQNPPKVWLNSSSATIYEGSRDKMQDEETGTIGNDFSMNVCKEWEQMFFSSELPQTRRVALRTSIVLGKGGGAMQPLLNLAKVGLGGTQGDGGQFFSWLHIKDFVKIVNWLIEHEQIEGVVNCVAPNPVTNKELMQILRKSVGMPLGLPLANWMLKLGAMLIQTETELILKSRKVYPKRLVEEGYFFQYTLLEDAIAEIVGTEWGTA